MNLKQIEERLNEIFAGGARLVFWYDDTAEFDGDADALRLSEAKVYRLTKTNQFYTKYFLERVDTKSKYLIYAPFPKPDVSEDHLEDTLLYSARFSADRAALLAMDLGADERYLPLLRRHIKFFASKERTDRFLALHIGAFSEEAFQVGLLSALCRLQAASFEDVLRTVLTAGLTKNPFLPEFEKYGLAEAFWALCGKHFGYEEEEPSLARLLLALFVTYASRYMNGKVPEAWTPFLTEKTGNAAAFLDGLMNSLLHRAAFDVLSSYAEEALHVYEVLGDRMAELAECGLFLSTDRLIAEWIAERLLTEDVGASLGGHGIAALCELRRKLHFAEKTEAVYRYLAAAHYIVSHASYTCPGRFGEIIERYTKEDFLIDRAYREFLYFRDRRDASSGIGEGRVFEALRERVENVYANAYLAKLLPAWNAGIAEEDAFSEVPLQRNFYRRALRNAEERTVVIISDAMRYEVGEELFRRLSDDPKCTARFDVQLSVLPSYTRLGMAALLPHETLTMTEDFRVLADGMPCDDLAGRQKVLQGHEKAGCCVQFDAVKDLPKAKFREVLTGQHLIYVYHNQIDARGDAAKTEDEVFNACEEAIAEIMAFIRKASGSGNTYHFFVTADHGFLYRRSRLTESDKVTLGGTGASYENRRFIMGTKPIEGDGIGHMKLGRVLGNEDEKFVSYPLGGLVFKMSGGGMNYVHGGSSPQEMLVPVVEVKMDRGHAETRKAEIRLITNLKKITRGELVLDFLQADAVCDTVRPAVWRLVFENASGERISSEQTYTADRRGTDVQSRIFSLTFTFKNREYESAEPCRLAVYDKETGLPAWSADAIMDMA